MVIYKHLKQILTYWEYYVLSILLNVPLQSIHD